MKPVEFESRALADLAWWIETDRAIARRLVRLLQELQRDPFAGSGKPEPLKHALAGCWSRRINSEHRLVYEVFPDRIKVLACRYHY